MWALVVGEGEGLEALDFDTLLSRLEGVVRRLESDEGTLEEALAAYEEGVRLHRQGHARLAAYERRLEELTGRGECAPLEADGDGE